MGRSDTATVTLGAPPHACQVPLMTADIHADRPSDHHLRMETCGRHTGQHANKQMSAKGTVTHGDVARAAHKSDHVVCAIQAERIGSPHRFSHHVREHGQASVTKRLLRGPRPVNLRPATHTHAHTRTQTRTTHTNTHDTFLLQPMVIIGRSDSEAATWKSSWYLEKVQLGLGQQPLQARCRIPWLGMSKVSHGLQQARPTIVCAIQRIRILRHQLQRRDVP